MTSYRQYRVWNSTTTSKKLVFILGITAQLIMLMLLFAWAAGYSEPNLGTLLANEWTLCIFALILFILHSFCFIVLFPPILKKKFKSYCSVCVCVYIYIYIYSKPSQVLLFNEAIVCGKRGKERKEWKRRRERGNTFRDQNCAKVTYETGVTVVNYWWPFWSTTGLRFPVPE